VDVFDESFELDGLTRIAEVGAALVPGIGGKEGAIDGDDLIREKAEQFGNLHKQVEDLVVESFSQAFFQICKSGLTRQMGILDARIESVMFLFFRIPKYFYKGFHVGILLEVAEQLQ